MFNMMDTDENGHLSFEELRDGLAKIGHTVNDPDVQMLLESVSSYLVFLFFPFNFDAFLSMSLNFASMSETCFYAFLSKRPTMMETEH